MPYSYDEFTSIPLFSDVLQMIDGWTDEMIANYVRHLRNYVVEGILPNELTIEAAVLMANATTIDGIMKRQVRNRRRTKGATEQDDTPASSGTLKKPDSGRSYRKPQTKSGNPLPEHGKPQTESGLPKRREEKRREEKTREERADHPSFFEDVEGDGGAWLQAAGLSGAALQERDMARRAYQASDADFSAAPPVVDCTVDSCLREDCDPSKVKSDSLPCMCQVWSERQFFMDGANVPHRTALGSLRATYSLRARGEANVLFLERGLKKLCPANCPKDRETVERCWTCFSEGLERWNAEKFRSPLPLIRSIVSEERGF